jgi:hypothetical protein
LDVPMDALLPMPACVCELCMPVRVPVCLCDDCRVVGVLQGACGRISHCEQILASKLSRHTCMCVCKYSSLAM